MTGFTAEAVHRIVADGLYIVIGTAVLMFLFWMLVLLSTELAFRDEARYTVPRRCRTCYDTGWIHLHRVAQRCPDCLEMGRRSG